MTDAMHLEDAKTLAESLMKQHGLMDWSFRFDHAYKRFGACARHKKRIQLSKKLTLVNSETEVRDIVLHEIAHALVGFGHKHNEVWKTKALEIGCRGERFFSHSVIKAPRVIRLWSAQCRACKRVHTRQRPMHGGYCACLPVTSESENTDPNCLQWTRGAEATISYFVLD